MIKLSNDVLSSIIEYFNTGDELLAYMLINKYIYNIVKYGEYNCNIIFQCAENKNLSKYNLIIDQQNITIFPKYVQILLIAKFSSSLSLNKLLDHIDTTHIRKVLHYKPDASSIINNVKICSRVYDCAIINLGKKMGNSDWNHITLYERSIYSVHKILNTIIHTNNHKKFIEFQHGYIDKHIDDILYQSYTNINEYNHNLGTFVTINTNQRIMLDRYEHEYIRKLYNIDKKLSLESFDWETTQIDKLYYSDNYGSNFQNYISTPDIILANTLSHINYVSRTYLSNRLIKIFKNQYSGGCIYLLSDYVTNIIDRCNIHGSDSYEPTTMCYGVLKSHMNYIIKNGPDDIYWPSTKREMKILYMIEYANKIYNTDCYDEEMTRFITFNPIKEHNTYPILDFIFGSVPNIKLKVVEPHTLYKLNPNINTFRKNFNILTKSIFKNICIKKGKYSNLLSRRLNRIRLQTKYIKKKMAKHVNAKFKSSKYILKSKYISNRRFIHCTKSIVIDFYVVGSIILKALSVDISRYNMTDVDIAIHINDNDYPFDKAISVFIKKIFKIKLSDVIILEKSENRYVIIHQGIQLDIFRIFDSINNVVRNFHLPPVRAVYDFNRLYGYASFYHSIYTSTIPYLHISKLHSKKKTVTKILNKYSDYGFRFLVKPLDEQKYFTWYDSDEIIGTGDVN